MKYEGKDVSSLWDSELLSAYAKLQKAEDDRTNAAKNDKFNVDRKEGKKVIKKLDFAPTNPAFLELKSHIFNEIQKRKLDITK